MDLDKSKSYGKVFGEGPKHIYEQDGKLFDGEGFWIHADGSRVTPKEKMAAAQRDLDTFNLIKKKEINKQMRKFEAEESRLKKEAEGILFTEAAKNLVKIEEPLSFFNSTEKVKDALDILEFPYDPDAKYSDLRASLIRIFDE